MAFKLNFKDIKDNSKRLPSAPIPAEELFDQMMAADRLKNKKTDDNLKLKINVENFSIEKDVPEDKPNKKELDECLERKRKLEINHDLVKANKEKRKKKKKKKKIHKHRNNLQQNIKSH